jgi:hypothetical protein
VRRIVRPVEVVLYGPIRAFRPLRPINRDVKVGLAAGQEVLTLGGGSFDPCCKMSRLAVRYLRDGEDHIRRDRGCVLSSERVPRGTESRI